MSGILEVIYTVFSICGAVLFIGFTAIVIISIGEVVEREIERIFPDSEDE